MTISVSGWIARAALIALLLLVAGVFGRGLALLGRDAARPKWQSYTFFSGLILLATALVSPLEDFVATYFTARALQQLLLTELIPFLILVSNPYQPIKTGLSSGMRNALQFLRTERWLRVIRVVAAPGVVWLLFVSTFWFWHDASMIALVSRSGLMHVVEIVTLLGLACLYWWHIAAVEPHIFRPMSVTVRFFYAFIGILPIKATGIIMLFGSESRVGGYADFSGGDTLMVNFFGVRLADASAGAIIIWVIGGIMYACTALLLASRLLGVEEDKPPLPVNPLLEDELWKMPGVGRESDRNRYGYKTRL